MVVDEQHANGHESGTSTRHRRARARRGLDRDLAPHERRAFTHSDQPESVRTGGLRVETPAIVLDHRHHRGVLLHDEDADTTGGRMLHDVRERLLHDAIERRLDRLRQALVRARATRSRSRGRFAPDRSPRADRAPRPSPKSSSAEGLSSTASRAHVLQRLDDELAQRRDTVLRVGSTGLLERLQPEEDRRQRLPGLVVQLARDPLALQLLGLDDASHGITAHALGQVDRNRRARGERLGQANVAVREARRRSGLVVRHHDTDRPAPVQ